MTSTSDISKRRDALERDRIRLNTEIGNIKSQLTAYICGNPKKRTNEWYSDANSALNTKKSQVARVSKQIDDLNRELKDRRKSEKDMKIRYTNEIFYHKLKEMMTEEEFDAFMDSVDEAVESRGKNEN